MKLLLYAPPQCPRAEELAQMIQTGLPHVHTTRTSSVDTLSRHLTQPLNRISIVLAFLLKGVETDLIFTVSWVSCVFEIYYPWF